MINFFYCLALVIGFSLNCTIPSSITPTQLVKTPKKMSDIPSIQQHNLNISNYFFSRLPQATLPANLLTEIQNYYKPLLAFLPPLTPNQTAQERAQEVMTHIEKFYGLLYNTVLFEKGLQSSKIAPTLTMQDLYRSDLWQNYLKISIAEFYTKEQSFLTQLFSDNQKIFKYIPGFELTYYNQEFISLRNNTELTRIYLMLSESMRKRMCSLSLDWAPLFNAINQAKNPSKTTTFIEKSKTGLKAIQDFKNKDFFINIEKLKAIDITKNFPISFNDPDGNPISFQQLLESNYDYSTYFTYSKKSGPKVISSFELFFTITQDPTTQQYNCYFTGLGHTIFAQAATTQDAGFPYGKIEYITLKLAGGKTKQKVSFKHNAFFNTLFNGQPPSPTFGFFCFLTVSSIKYLHCDLTPLFTPEYLERSLTLIEQQRKSNPTFPSCINYAQSDYLYLKKINNIYKNLQIDPAQNSTGTPQSSAVHFFKKLVTSVVQAAEDFAADITDAANLFAQAVGHAVVAAVDEAVVLYYTSCILPAICQGMDAGDALHHAAEYQAKVSEQLTSCMNNLTNVVDDLGSAVEAIKNAANTIIGSVIGIMDQKLGDDITGLLDTLVDSEVDFMETAANSLIQTTMEMVILSADAINMIAMTFTMVMGGQVFNKEAWGAFGDGAMNMIQDTVASLLANISLAVHFVGEELKNAMLCFSYIISFITESIVVISASLEAAGEFIGTFIATGNIDDAADAANAGYWDGYHSVQQYSIIIGSVVGIVLLVAVTVLTGGVSLEVTGPMIAMMAMNIGMATMSLAGAVQNNLTAIEKQDREETMVSHYKNYVIDSFGVSQGIQGNRGLESLVQYKMAQDNTERSLLYYQNSYNAQTNNAISQQAYSVGVYANNLATPNWNIYNSPASGATVYPYDTSVSVQGDLGQLYGINTTRLTLAPSTGFSIYNQGRDTCAQEALVDPVVIPQKNIDSSLENEKKLETFWFQQKDVSFLPVGTPISTDVVWRVTTHKEAPFYVGVYLTERAIDLGTLQNLFTNYQQLITGNSNVSYDNFKKVWTPFDTYNKYIVDFDSVAKLFVLHRNPIPEATINQNNKAQLGIYTVNSMRYTTGWAPTAFNDINFKRGTWYRMTCSLANGKLSVAFYEVGDDDQYDKLLANPSASSQPLAQTTIEVEQATYSPNLLAVAPALKNYGGSIGFVASGAAVEYKVLHPTLAITSTSIRTSEYDNLLTTVFQNTKPMEKDREIAWQQSLKAALAPTYGSLKLKAVDEMNIMTGMFVYYNNSITPADIVTFFTQDENGHYTLNVNPSSQVQGIASLATGLTYNSSGSITGYIANIASIYQKQHTTLSKKITGEITSLQNNFMRTLQAPIAFNNITLQLIPTSNPSIFVYQGPSLLLKGMKDFYIAGCVTANGVGSSNIPFITSNSHNTINAFISITSGVIYNLQTNQSLLTPLIPAPSLNPSLVRTLNLVGTKNVYTIYNNYKSYLTGSYAQTLAQTYAAYKQYEINLAQEAAFEVQLSNAINQATAAAQNASTQAGLAQSSSPSAAQAATTASQAATTAAVNLQSLLARYQQAAAAMNNSLIASLTTQANQQLQITLQAATAANNAATAAQNAITQATMSLLSSGSSSAGSSTPSGNSSVQNFNTTLGSLNSNDTVSDNSFAGSSGNNDAGSGLSL